MKRSGKLLVKRRGGKTQVNIIPHRFLKPRGVGIEDWSEIVNSNHFRNLWNINKDNIEICKDCEFRYCCPDNRLPIIQGNRVLFEEDCLYNPYTNTWNET